jgi:putative membrane protein
MLVRMSRRGRIELREDTQSRDHLAFVRTVLALERTVLAYVRTALAFAAVGVAVAHFLPEAWLALWSLGALAGIMFAVAVYRSVRVGLSLLDTKAKAGATSRT